MRERETRPLHSGWMIAAGFLAAGACVSKDGLMNEESSPSAEPREATADLEGKVVLLGRDDVPIGRKRELKKEIVAAGKPAIPVLIAHLEDGAIYEHGRDVQNYMGLPPHLPPPKPLLAEIRVGEECRDMLSDLITPVYRSPYERNIKVISWEMLVVRDWRAWWAKNEHRSLAEIHEEMKPLVDRYWQEGGIGQAVP